MAKYIDAEKLIKFKEMLADIIASSQGICTYQACKDMAEEEALLLIATLQQEQQEDSKGKFVFPKFLYARTTDNKTIDVSYVPQSVDAIEYVRNNSSDEQSDVDLEKDIQKYFQGYWPGMETQEQCNTDMHFTPPAIMRLVKYAYELGLNARKEESK